MFLLKHCTQEMGANLAKVVSFEFRLLWIYLFCAY